MTLAKTRGRRPNSRVTIDDVAREAGVSLMSVSRAMRGIEGVSAAKRDQIVSIAQKLGYRPNSVAGSLAAADSTLIGLSIPTLFDAVFSEIFEGMRRPLLSAGFQTVIDTTDYDPTNESGWVERMLSWHPAGLILSGVHHSRATRKRLRHAGVPTLEIWDVTDDPIDMCVGIDHFDVGAEMGRYLVELGYQRPAYVGLKAGRDIRAEARFEGLASVFSKTGIDIQQRVDIDDAYSFEAGRMGVEMILESDQPRPDIIYFLNDNLAFGGLMACEVASVSVPDEIGIVGFNGLTINSVLPKRITTSVTPRARMGETAARMLVARIKGARAETTKVLPVELAVGETTRAPQLEAPVC